MTASSSSGRSGTRSLGRGGGSSRCAKTTAMSESRTNGTSPVRHS